MLSDKKLLVLFLGIIFLFGCGKKEGDEGPQGSLTENNDLLKKKVKDVINTDVDFILKGNFVSDSLTEFASGSEIVNKKEWGIRFYLFNIKEGSVEKKYETPLLNGSFKESKVEKIKLVNASHDYIYYNSMDYFMGSGGGEVLAYIIDLKGQIIYYAHLVTEPEGKVELFVSNLGNNDILKYFLDVFKKDYPTLKLTAKDPVLD